MNKEKILESLKGGLIVSCQAVEGDPIYTPDMTVKMAECAKWGGAVGIRANTPNDIRNIKEATGLPIIGLYKIYRNDTKVYLTPTIEAAKEVWNAGAEIIAVQATSDIYIDGRKSYELIKDIKKEIPEAIIFADIRTIEDAKNAIEYGADIVAPTFYSNYDNYSFENEKPDFLMLHKLVKCCKDKALVIMEGNMYTPEEAVQAIFFGAHSAVVGSAITRPHRTAKRFVNMLNKFNDAQHE